MGLARMGRGQESSPWRHPEREARRLCFVGIHPVHWSRTQKGPVLGLMLCCHQLEILNSFWTRCLTFYFALDPENYVAGPGHDVRSPPFYVLKGLRSPWDFFESLFYIFFIEDQAFELLLVSWILDDYRGQGAFFKIEKSNRTGRQAQEERQDRTSLQLIYPSLWACIKNSEICLNMYYYWIFRTNPQCRSPES